MGRKTVTIRIDDENRDKGKVFIVTEMPAVAGERWAFRLLSLLKKSGADLPQAEVEGEPQEGMEALAAKISTSTGIAFLEALQDPSLDAWWECVEYQHARDQLPQKIVREPPEACQIEEIGTITRLRMEVLKLHTDFFSPEKGSTSASPSHRVVPTGSSPTRISRPRSAQ